MNLLAFWLKSITHHLQEPFLSRVLSASLVLVGWSVGWSCPNALNWRVQVWRLWPRMMAVDVFWCGGGELQTASLKWGYGIKSFLLGDLSCQLDKSLEWSSALLRGSACLLKLRYVLPGVFTHFAVRPSPSGTVTRWPGPLKVRGQRWDKDSSVVFREQNCVSVFTCRFGFPWSVNRLLFLLAFRCLPC